MSHRYAQLPNNDEMEAAFDDSEDQDVFKLDSHTTSHSIPGSYNLDYDYPPPGSPPPHSTVAFPNDHGNSNGVVPAFTIDSTTSPRHARGWFQRSVVGLLPTHYVRQLGFASEMPAGAVGGGINNDGVFANVTAKPSRPVRITEGDDTYIVPEDSRAEAPPSYAAAQADAVPPYWETTVHAPFSGDSIGDMIIDSLPSGSLFSFLWNMLVSISFQFVGFLLTYLLHTSHAACLGSRAGLGVTLIQYGFALRSKEDAVVIAEENGDSWMATAARAANYYKNMANMANTTATMPPVTTEEQASKIVADATTEWLSFFLMTVGWFVLLTSVLGFWRVKRWERGILASRRENTQEESGRSANIISHITSTLIGSRGRADTIQQGFDFSQREERQSEEENDQAVNTEGAEREPMLPIDRVSNSERERRMVVLAHERRLQHDLREAGLL